LAVRARPLRIWLERVRVQVRRHVARRTRIRVLEPGAAEARGFLEDHEVVDAGAPERDAGGQPRESRSADDRVEHAHSIAAIQRKSIPACGSVQQVKTLTIVVVAALALLAGCKDKWEKAVSEMTGFKTKMCACETRVCTNDVLKQWDAWEKS